MKNPETEFTTDSRGHVKLTVEMVYGESTVTAAYASSPMKLITPVSRGKSAWAMTSSFGGGLVAGDQTRLDVAVGPGACCFVGTQSSTKVYRNPARLPCSHATAATLGGGALLVFAPDPVQSFADSEYVQRQEFHLESDAGLVLLDWCSSGRAARGERWEFARFESRNDVFVDGERVVVDSMRLAAGSVRERMGRFNCLATLMLIGPKLKSAAEALCKEIAARPVVKRAAVLCSASAIQAGAMLRVAGEEVETVRRELRGQLAFLGDLLGDDPFARKW